MLTFVVVSFQSEQLSKMGLAVNLALKRGKVAQLEHRIAVSASEASLYEIIINNMIKIVNQNRTQISFFNSKSSAISIVSLVSCYFYSCNREYYLAINFVPSIQDPTKS